jgi:hypothetical protein
MTPNTTEGEHMTDAKTQPQAPAKREKKATYMVLRSTGAEGAWQLLTTSPIAAPSRKAAIRAAAKAEAEGTFLVLAAKEYNPTKRTVRQLTVDAFE